MVKLTLLGTNKTIFYLNPHQIEAIEGVDEPNPTIVMLSGKRIKVIEDIETIIKRIILYRRKIGIFKNEE